MGAVESSVTTTVGVKVRSRILFEISVGGTSVLLDWSAASSLYRDLRTQFETAEIVRINIKCATTSSSINNFPLSRDEVKALLNDLDWYVNA